MTLSHRTHLILWLAPIALAAVVLLLLLFPPGPGGGETILIGRSYLVPSRILGAPRGINVHLPEHYEETDATYPVLIKLFGGPWEYFAGLAAEVGSLSGFNDIPPLIVVGVDQMGHEEVLPRATGGNEVPVRAEEFRDFLRTELLPWLEREFRTNGFHILLGTYDCGLFGVWTWLTEPDLFDAVLVTNPGWARDYSPLPDWFAARAAATSSVDPFLHLTGYHYPPETGNRPPDPFPDLLERELTAPGRAGLRWEVTRLERESNDAHREYTSCREGLLALFRDYPCPRKVLDGGMAAVDTYYAGLSSRLGFEVAVPEMPLMQLSDRLMETGEAAESIEVLLRLEADSPWSLNPVYRLAWAYQALGDRPNALVRFREGVRRGMPEFFRVQMEELERSAASAIEHEFKTGGQKAGRSLFERVRSGRRKDLVLAESEMNAAGYRLLKAGRIIESVALFEMNTELYPESGNVWDSLGEALIKKGERERAIAAYRRSLELDPANTNAVEMLRSLGIQP